MTDAGTIVARASVYNKNCDMATLVCTNAALPDNYALVQVGELLDATAANAELNDLPANIFRPEVLPHAWKGLMTVENMQLGSVSAWPWDGLEKVILHGELSTNIGTAVFGHVVSPSEMAGMYEDEHGHETNTDRYGNVDVKGAAVVYKVKIREGVDDSELYPYAEWYDDPACRDLKADHFGAERVPDRLRDISGTVIEALLWHVRKLDFTGSS